METTLSCLMDLTGGISRSNHRTLADIWGAVMEKMRTWENIFIVLSYLLSYLIYIKKSDQGVFCVVSNFV